MAEVLRKSLDNEEVCLSVSTVLRNMVESTLYPSQKATIFSDIGTKLIFQTVSRHEDKKEICENMLSVLGNGTSFERDKKAFYDKKNTEVSEELSILKEVMTQYKKSRTVVRYCLAYSFRLAKSSKQ